jgi:hypothetical protein
VTHEKNFTTMVLMLKIWRTFVPFRKPVISGMPDPPAQGRRYCKYINSDAKNRLHGC